MLMKYSQIDRRKAHDKHLFLEEQIAEAPIPLQAYVTSLSKNG